MSEEKEDDLDKLREKISEDLKIDRENLKKELETNGNKYHRYLELLMEEKKALRRLKGMRYKLYRKLYHHFKFENEHRLKTKDEVEVYIKGDDNMVRIHGMINKTKDKIEYLDQVLNLFRMRSFSIKNMIDLIKLEAGGFA